MEKWGAYLALLRAELRPLRAELSDLGSIVHALELAEPRLDEGHVGGHDSVGETRVVDVALHGDRVFPPEQIAGQVCRADLVHCVAINPVPVVDLVCDLVLLGQRGKFLGTVVSAVSSQLGGARRVREVPQSQLTSSSAADKALNSLAIMAMVSPKSALGVSLYTSFNRWLMNTAQGETASLVGSSFRSAVCFNCWILSRVFCSSVRTFFGVLFFAWFAPEAFALAVFFVPAFFAVAFFEGVLSPFAFFLGAAEVEVVFRGVWASANPLAKTAATRMPLGMTGVVRGASCTARRLELRRDELPPTRTCRAVARPIVNHMTMSTVFYFFYFCAAAIRELVQSLRSLFALLGQGSVCGVGALGGTARQRWEV